MLHLEHINLVVKNISRSLEFYQAAFPRWKVRGGDNTEWYGQPRNCVEFVEYLSDIPCERNRY